MVTKVKITPSPPWYLFNKHLETIYPALFRKTNNRRNTTIRIITNDNDFIDLDIYDSKANKTVILSHGLEGNSRKSYMTGMIDVLVNAGFNCVAWNYRGCSGTINKYPYSYHSGATQDLDYIVKATIDKFPLTDIFLIGFSLGGNLTLKYLGENSLNPKVSKAVAISTPLDLYNSVLKISKASNWIYTKRFLNTLKIKIKKKAKLFPNEINIKGLNKISNLMEFDDRYTAPLHGFTDALDYYTKCSSIHFLKKIKVPTLIINARNDPFLSKDCYPENINPKYISCDYPIRGGHLGFKMNGNKNKYYHEIKSLEFISK